MRKGNKYFRKSEIFLKCNIAGLSFHNEDDIADELSVGDEVILVRQKDNKYDEYAVAVALPDDYEGNPDTFDFRYILGYIPKGKNVLIARMLDMGWNDMFKAEISEINYDSSLEDRIHISVSVVSKERYIAPDIILWCVSLKKEEMSTFQSLLYRDGYAFYLWDGKQPTDSNRPKRDDYIVICFKGQTESMLYLTKAGHPENGNIDQDSSIDDDNAYFLHNIVGPVQKFNERLEFLMDERIGAEPNYPLSPDATIRLLAIFKMECELKDIPEPIIPLDDHGVPETHEAKPWYVRCQENDGSDYIYRTCNSKEEAQAIVNKQNSNDALYEHLYITDKKLENISGDD